MAAEGAAAVGKAGPEEARRLLPAASFQDPASAPRNTGRSLTLLWLSQAFLALQMTMPYTLSAYMVRSFAREGQSEATIGQLAGLLAAAAAFPRIFSSYPWGIVSDKIGRKVVVLIGITVMTLGMLGFGLATTYVTALLSRLLPGILNGAPVALKAMVGDSPDAQIQARAMSIVTLGFSTGTVLGPALGGLLAEPCEQYGASFPLCTARGLFRVRPYLLPCIVVAAIGTTILLLDIFMMEETQPDLRAKRLRRLKSGGCAAKHGAAEATETPGRARLRSGELELSPSLGSDGQLRSLLRGLGGDGKGEEDEPPAPQSQPGSELFGQLEGGPDGAQQESGMEDKGLLKSGAGGAQNGEAHAEVERDGERAALLVSPAAAARGIASGAGAPRRLPSLDRPLLLERHVSFDESADLSWAGRNSMDALRTPRSGGGASPAGSSRMRASPFSNRGDSAAELLRNSATGRGRSLPEAVSTSGKVGEPQGKAERRTEMAGDLDGDPENPGAGPREEAKWWRQRSVRAALVGSGFTAFIFNVLKELAPIFASAPRDKGGLGMPLGQFTYSIIFGGVIMAIFSLFLYPGLQKRLGPLNVCRLGLWGGLPSALIIPATLLVAPNVTLEQVILFVGMGLKGVCEICGLTSSTILINLCVERSQIGAVNGVGMSLASLARTAGPALSGTMWAVSVWLASVPGHQAFGFVLVAAGCVLTQIPYARLQVPDRRGAG